MLLIKPNFFIRGDVDGKRILSSIETAGRTCYKSEDKITLDSAETFVRMIIKRGHESVLEHESVSVLIVCDRSVSHELVRHRLASYSQESTRYCDYSRDGVTFVIPPWLNIPEGKCTRVKLTPPQWGTGAWSWLDAVRDAELSYLHLLELGWKPEQARAVLPNSLKTEVVMTCNLRQWRHFFTLRTAHAAHPQMREIARPMLAAFKRLVPVVFDDIPEREEMVNHG